VMRRESSDVFGAERGYESKFRKAPALDEVRYERAISLLYAYGASHPLRRGRAVQAEKRRSSSGEAHADAWEAEREREWAEAGRLHPAGFLRVSQEVRPFRLRALRESFPRADLADLKFILSLLKG